MKIIWEYYLNKFAQKPLKYLMLVMHNTRLEA